MTMHAKAKRAEPHRDSGPKPPAEVSAAAVAARAPLGRPLRLIISKGAFEGNRSVSLLRLRPAVTPSLRGSNRLILDLINSLTETRG